MPFRFGQYALWSYNRRAMSFDIFLYKFLYGEPALIDRDAVMAVLNRYDFSGPNEYGRYDVRFPDGVDVEFWA